MRRRVATPDELGRAVKAHGPGGAARALRRYGLIPPIAGASGIAIDASTPALVTTTTVANTLTTGSFTPPLNAILAVLCADGSNATTFPAPTNAGGGVTWASAAQVALQGNFVKSVSIWLGQVTTSASMTVSEPTTAGSSSWIMGVVVITGALALASQTGATQSATSTNGTPSATIASLTGSGSLVLGVVADTTNNTPTLGTNQSSTFNGHSFQFADSTHNRSDWAQYDTRMSLAAGASITLNDTAPTGTNYTIAMAEILAAAGGTPQGPVPPMPNWPQAMWRSAYR